MTGLTDEELVPCMVEELDVAGLELADGMLELITLEDDVLAVVEDIDVDTAADDVVLDITGLVDEELVPCMVEELEVTGLETADGVLELTGLEGNEPEEDVDDESVTPIEVVLDMTRLEDEEPEDCVAEELELAELKITGLERAVLELATPGLVGFVLAERLEADCEADS